MKSILVTGFGPFRDHKINASWEAVKLLPDELEEFKIIKMEIPVAYHIVETKIPELWAELDPKIVIHVGVSAFTSDLKIEKRAHRHGYTSADCMGNYRCDGIVCSEGDECILTNLNVKQICEQVNNVGVVKASPSDDAGRYLCEFTYYTSLKINRGKVLFIHVPPLEKPYSAKELSDGLLCIIKSILENEDIVNMEKGMSCAL